MIRPPTSERTSPPRETSPGWKRLYGFLAISLALFLLSLAIWRPAVRAHVALAQLAIPARPPVELEADLVSALTQPTSQPTTDGTVQSLLATVRSQSFLDAAIPEHLRETVTGDGQGARWTLTDRLRIDTRALDKTGVRLIRIRYVDPDPERAYQLLSHVTEELEEKLNETLAADDASAENAESSESLTGRSDEASSELADVTTQLRETEAALLEYEHQELARFRAEWEAAQAHAADTAERSETGDTLEADEWGVPHAGNGETPDEVAALRSRIETLQGEIAAAERELELLLQKRTQEHPSVIMVEAKLRELRQELSQAPVLPADAPSKGDEWESAAPPADLLAGTLSVDGASPHDSATVIPWDEATAMAEIRRSVRHAELVQLVMELRGELDRLTKSSHISRDRAADDATTRVPSAVSSVRRQAKVVTKPQIAHRIRHPLTAGHLLRSGGGAIGIAFLLLLIPGQRVTQPYFTTAQEAASRLGVNLIGQVPTANGPPIIKASARGISPFTERFVGVSEWFIVVAVFTLVTIAAVDHRIGGHLLGDPLDAYMQAVDRLRDFVLGRLR